MKMLLSVKQQKQAYQKLSLFFIFRLQHHPLMCHPV